MRRRVWATAMTLAVVLAACAGGGGEATTTSLGPASTTTSEAATTTTKPATTTIMSVTSTTQAPTTTSGPSNPDGAEGSGCAPGSDTSLPDGRWYGFVTESTGTAIEFDLACWFTGQAAIDASAEDGEESPPPNDYYVRNQNERTRSLAVSSDLEVIFYPTGDPNGETRGTFEEWRAMVEQRGPYFGVWLDIVGGEVAGMAEQWVP